MRTSRIVALTALVVLTVSGCSATTAPPVGPSDAELNAAVRIELDKQWRYTGLEGVVPRPEAEVELVGSGGAASQGFRDCMSANGFESWGYSSDTGLQMFGSDGNPSAASPEQQLAFYLCNARFPMIDTLTVDQLDFIYDYYQDWLIPCLEVAGYPVGRAPSRESFTTEPAEFGWRWRPYSAIPDVLNPQDYAALQSTCRPTIPGIDGWSERLGIF